MWLDLPLLVLLAMWMLRRAKLRSAKLIHAEYPAKELRLQASIITQLAQPFETEGGLKRVCHKIASNYAQSLVDEAEKLDNLHVIMTGEFREGEQKDER